jgi:hypothetical protein
MFLSRVTLLKFGTPRIRRVENLYQRTVEFMFEIRTRADRTGVQRARDTTFAVSTGSPGVYYSVWSFVFGTFLLSAHSILLFPPSRPSFL